MKTRKTWTLRGTLTDPANESLGGRQELSVKNIMTAPTSYIRISDSPDIALKEMKKSGVTGVFVVGEKMEVIGLLTPDNALRVKNGEISMNDAVVKDISFTSDGVLLPDLLDLAAETRYPIAVVNEKKQLKGIVTRAALISSLA